MTPAEKNWKDFTFVATKAHAARMGDKRMRNCVYACGGIREQSKAYAAKRMRGVNVELRQVDDDESDSEV